MAELNTVRVNQLRWYEDTELEMQFPPSWDVTVYHMRGYLAPVLSEAQIKQAFANPIGTRRIRDLAKGKKEVMILFDDVTRPTKVYKYVPYILQELEEAGISDNQIRFIAAIASHRPMGRLEFAKKLGEDVVDRFLYYNHNAWQNFSYLGKTSRGTPVNVNSEVMSCDLKIGIGSIIPHQRAGFGGGAKIIMPGVSSLETIWSNHSQVGTTPPTAEHPRGIRHPSLRTGAVEDNPARLDMEEVARMAGLDFIVNNVINEKANPIGLFTGDVVAAHREGVKMAREVYATEPIKDADVIIVNHYIKSNESGLGLPEGVSFKKGGGSLVSIINTPDGQVVHYLSGAFGKKFGGYGFMARLSSEGFRPLPRGVNKLIALSPNRDPKLEQGLSPNSVVWAKTWSEALEELRKSHQGKATVAVIPDAILALSLSSFPD